LRFIARFSGDFPAFPYLQNGLTAKMS